jgi:hypothetical protein
VIVKRGAFDGKGGAMNYDVAEPMARLSTGVNVMQDLFDSLTRLQALGHIIEVDE